MDVPGTCSCALPLYFCGDGNFYITTLRWSSWTKTGAAATGQAHQNACVPFCAGARYEAYPVIVDLAQPVSCSDGRREYTLLTYRFVARKPPHISAGPHIITAPLGVGGPRCP